LPRSLSPCSSASRMTFDRSYGVQVARLAGLPASVIDRAKVILEALEQGERERGKPTAIVDDLPLFQQDRPVEPSRTSAIETRLKEIVPDTLSPRDALDLIYELKAALSK
ncbi:MAG: hypothetical protein AAFV38_07640, partial [Pseudomonadota bacterium]